MAPARTAAGWQLRPPGRLPELQGAALGPAQAVRTKGEKSRLAHRWKGRAPSIMLSALVSVPPPRLELGTGHLVGSCSFHLSYGGTWGPWFRKSRGPPTSSLDPP